MLVVDWSERKISENHSSGNTGPCLITHGGLLLTCITLTSKFQIPEWQHALTWWARKGEGACCSPFFWEGRKTMLIGRGRATSSVQALKTGSHHVTGSAVLCTPRSWDCQLWEEGGGSETWGNSADSVWNNQMWNFKAWTGVDISECTFVWVSALQSPKIKVRLWWGKRDLSFEELGESSFCEQTVSE